MQHKTAGGFTNRSRTEEPDMFCLCSGVTPQLWNLTERSGVTGSNLKSD